MGISLSTARFAAPAAFLYDFAMQQYGMLSSPNMKDIHDANPASFSPQPFFIGGFFGPQQILQVIWLRQLWLKDGEVEKNTISLVPFYIFGNLLIGTWLPFWNAEKLKIANIFVTLNTFSTLYWVFFVRDPSAGKRSWQGWMTNAVGITFAGIGVLDFLHNTSVAFYPRTPPTALIQALTYIGFPLLSLMSPSLFGVCLAYCQVGLGVGQYQLAQKALGVGEAVGRFGAYGGGGGMGWAKGLIASGAITGAVAGYRYLVDKRFV